jgi:type II secretory pathway component PulM
MKGYFARLSPTERRFVVGVGVLLFIVLNVWLVPPKIAEWKQVQDRMFKARRSMRLYETAINDKPRLERLVRELESEGQDVPFEDQATRLLETIRSQAVSSGASFLGNTRTTTRTNQFFVEQLQTVSLQSGEKPLVDFLYTLGEGNSLIRVRDLSLRPQDANRQQGLAASVTLVASYQKKPSTRPAPTATKAPATASKTPAPTGASKASTPPASKSTTTAPKTNAPPPRTAPPTTKLNLPGSKIATNKPTSPIESAPTE